MNIHTLHFGDSPLFQKLARVLEYSVQKNSPNTPLTIHTINEKEEDISLKNFRKFSTHDIKNTWKTKHHRNIVQSTRDGECICMLDLDTAVLGDLSALDFDFDFAYTVRKQKAKINSGVIFLRVSEKTKQWYETWYNVVLDLLDNPKLFKPLKQRYRGINQAALTLMLENPHDLKLKELPGEIWNCTPVNYSQFSKDTKVIHLLDNARILKNPKVGLGVKVAKAWIQLEKEMKCQN